MAKVKLIVSDQKTGKSYQVEAVNKISGMNIGDELDGGSLGLGGYRLKITGGSNKDGTPMKSDLPGGKRKKILFRKGGQGFKPRHDGERRRKMVCGEQIISETSQVNTIISKYGEKSVEDLLGLTN
ncbi:MAG: 30S ribosomal protein S6e [Candidatus Methanolliviera hydrocarbonicum]|uniref:Small ribosomal subunit protein eS6 n=1 Tax=Candidatus Methanolliviera hydrocarbonicum TaxID=2491085 RepID=A0A520KYS9_9EURY|nr:MAG: 30S ribosomal protein S6e [Candidatus Methanolliviera hydrocarbonicum]